MSVPMPAIITMTKEEIKTRKPSKKTQILGSLIIRYFLEFIKEFMDVHTRERHTM